MRLLIMLSLMVGMLAACEPGDPTPELVEIQQVPTDFIRTAPPPTPTPSQPIATPSPIPPSSTPPPRQTLRPSAVPVVVSLVVAVQPIPAGYAIPPEAVRVVMWPVESAQAVPFNALSDLDQVVNEVTLVDIVCYEPILSDTIARREVGSEFLPLPETCTPLDTGVSDFVDVVVAVQTIPAGTVIPPQAVRLARWPRAYLPPGVIMTLAEAVGQTATTTIYREQPILDQRVD